MGKIVARTGRADLIIDAAVALFLERPREEVTSELLAERTGFSYWQVYTSHGNARNLFRAAIARLAQQVTENLAAMPKDAPSVGEAVRAYGQFAAEVMQHESYAQFLYLLIRDRSSEPLLGEIYEQRIARTLRDGLTRIIGNTGLHNDRMILLSAASTRAFVGSLEMELVLPKLLPGFEPPTASAVAATVKRVADQALAASYALGSQAA
jgi:AcrR family transcriptional regulator